MRTEHRENLGAAEGEEKWGSKWRKLSTVVMNSMRLWYVLSCTPHTMLVGDLITQIVLCF